MGPRAGDWLYVAIVTIGGLLLVILLIGRAFGDFRAIFPF